MHITLDDICGMASPGWGEDVEVLDEDRGEVLDESSGDDYNEIAFNLRAKSEYRPEDEKPDVKGLYTDGGEREGLSTNEICDLLKNVRMTKKNLLEQEFSAILKTYPKNGADFKILFWLAHGFSYIQTAARLGRTHRTIKNVARRLRQFRYQGIVKRLPPDRVQTGKKCFLSRYQNRGLGASPKRSPRSPWARSLVLISSVILSNWHSARRAGRPSGCGARACGR